LYVQAPVLYQRGELVVCTDEKTGIQALERKHPGKPVQPKLPQLWEPEYLRHGTRCLLATFVVPTGHVYGDVTARRSNQDFRAHLRRTVAWLTQRYPQVRKVHWVMDNRASARTWMSPKCNHSDVSAVHLAWQETLF